MRRLALAFLMLCAGCVVAACGDAGDHFGEFRCTVSCTPATAQPTTAPTGSPTVGPTTGPQAVAKMKLLLPSTPNPQSAGTFNLVITVYASNGRVVAPGTALRNPIQLTSNASCNVVFNSNGTSATSLTLSTAPSNVTITYTPPSSTCTAPSVITITAFDTDARPQTATVSFAGESTVVSMKLSMLATPNPTSDGIYPFFVTAKDAQGKTIPAGTVLSNPIQLSSNASCVTTFGFNSTDLTQTLEIPSVQQVYVAYDPAKVGLSCTAPTEVEVTAIAQGAKAATFTFPAASSSTGLSVSKLALSMPVKPSNPQSGGTYPVTITAYDPHGKIIPPGTPLETPILLTSDSSCNISFTSPTTSGTAITLKTAPSGVNVVYTPPSQTCTPPAVITITASDSSAHPNSVSFEVLGVTTQVASISLTMPNGTPNPQTAGTYGLVIAAKDNHGKSIAAGALLSNPISLTSNAQCVTSFGLPSGAPTPTLNISSFASLVNLQYNPAAATGNCPTPSQVNITAAATGATTGKFSFVGSVPSTPAPVQAVKKIALSMPATPNPLSPGTFTFVVSAYASNGKQITPGSTLQNPLQIGSNDSCAVNFSSGTATGSALTLTTAPGDITITYTPPNSGCPAVSPISLQVFDLDAKPQSSSFALLGGTDTVASISLTTLQVPNPISEGVYPLFITVKNSKGNVIPYGTTLTNPVQLSSNASCTVTFGTNPAGNFNQLFTLTNTNTQTYMLFNPGAASPACPGPAPGPVIVTAISPTGTSGSAVTTFTFPF